MASPKREYLLSTKKRPTIEHKTAIAIPEINALCIKLYDKNSGNISNDDAYVPALKLQNIVVSGYHFQKTLLILHERIVFY